MSNATLWTTIWTNFMIWAGGISPALFIILGYSLGCLVSTGIILFLSKYLNPNQIFAQAVDEIQKERTRNLRLKNKEE